MVALKPAFILLSHIRHHVTLIQKLSRGVNTAIDSRHDMYGAEMQQMNRSCRGTYNAKQNTVFGMVVRHAEHGSPAAPDNTIGQTVYGLNNYL